MTAEKIREAIDAFSLAVQAWEQSRAGAMKTKQLQITRTALESAISIELIRLEVERDAAITKLERYKQAVARNLQYDIWRVIERWGDGEEAAILLDSNDALRKERDLIACTTRGLIGVLPKCHYCSAPATIDADDGYKICDDHLETCRADAESGDGTLEPIDLPYGKALREIKQLFDVRKKTT
jgi:hypothetical protein